MDKKIVVFILNYFFFLFFCCSSLSKERLMTWQEYYSQPSRHKPYVLELDTGKGDLCYYGVIHTVEPTDSQIGEIERLWEMFRPSVAYSEGGIWPVEASKDEAIKRHGEQGLLRYLAHRDKVTVKSIDPCRMEEALYLLNTFPPEKVKVFYCLRRAAINRMMKRNLEDTAYVTHILNKLSRLKECRDGPNTLAGFEERVSCYFPGLDDWRMVPLSWFCSSESCRRWTNVMSREVNDFRNKRMIKLLVREIKKGKRIFALVGRSHVVMQESVLRLKARNM